MPNITLVPTRATLGFSSGDTLTSSGDRPCLSFKVKPEKPWRNEVRLTTGEKFGELDGTVALRAGAPPADWKPIRIVLSPISGREEDVPVIGRLGYWEKREDDFDSQPANYLAELWIASDQFTELVFAARAGRLPRFISLEVVGDGIKYGWEPDGSGKEWNNKERPHLVITKAYFATVLAIDATDVDEDDAIELSNTDNLPATRAQAAQIHKLLVRIASWPMKLFWVLVIVVVAYLLVKLL